MPNDSFVWMHPPRDLTPQLVPEAEVTLLQGMGWLHADPPARTEVSEPEPEPEPESKNETNPTEGETKPAENETNDEHLEPNADAVGHQQELGNGPDPREHRKRGRRHA